MKKAWPKILFLRGNQRSRLALLLASCLLTGCAGIMRDPCTAWESRYKPSNTYSDGQQLAPQIKRVAVLPLSAPPGTAWLESGVETLQPVVLTELAKTKRFDLVPVAPAQLADWTGQLVWTPDEPLPADFLKHLRAITGCDAILFCQLTRYHPYQPVAIGWKFTLVDSAGGRVQWAADEVFDGGNRAIANSAEDYAYDHFTGQGWPTDAALVLSSPTRFGQYGLNALFATLPPR